LALPLLTFGNLVLAQVYPISLTQVLDAPINCVGAVSLYMYAFGYVKQHPVNRFDQIANKHFKAMSLTTSLILGLWLITFKRLNFGKKPKFDNDNAILTIL
jgi:hypothetical protein